MPPYSPAGMAMQAQGRVTVRFDEPEDCSTNNMRIVSAQPTLKSPLRARSGRVIDV